MGNDDSPRPGFDHWVAMPGQGEAIDPSLNVDGTRVQAKGYVTDLLTDYVERFIERPADQPFLVYLAHKAIHPNVDPAATTAASCRCRVSPAGSSPPSATADATPAGRCRGAPNAFKPPLGKPALLRQIDALPPLGRETATTDEEIRGRLEMLLGVDDSLGRILATLEKQGRARRHRRRVHERSRLLLRRARAERGAAARLRRDDSHSAARCAIPRRDRPANVTPSQMVAQHRPGADAARAGGRSARRRSAGPLARPRARAAIHGTGARRSSSSTSATPCSRASSTWATSAARTERHKYIQYRELQGMDELYDLEADPFEETNIIGRPDASGTLERMQSELRSSARADEVIERVMRRTKPVKVTLTAASLHIARAWIVFVLIAGALVVGFLAMRRFLAPRSRPSRLTRCAECDAVIGVAGIPADGREHEPAARARARGHGVDSRRRVLDGRAGSAGHARCRRDAGHDDSRPIHRVYVDGFWMDATEVTNEQFAAFVKATGYVTVAERTPRAEDFPGAPPENLVAGSVVFSPPDSRRAARQPLSLVVVR